MPFPGNNCVLDQWANQGFNTRKEELHQITEEFWAEEK
jgi:hypothetical protein